MKKIIFFQIVLLLSIFNKDSIAMQKNIATLDVLKKSQIIKKYHASGNSHDKKKDGKIYTRVKELGNYYDKNLDKRLVKNFICNTVATTGNLIVACASGIPALAIPVVPQTLHMILCLLYDKYSRDPNKPELIKNLEFYYNHNSLSIMSCNKHSENELEDCITYSENRLRKLNRYSALVLLHMPLSCPTYLLSLSGAGALIVTLSLGLVDIAVDPSGFDMILKELGLTTMAWAPSIASAVIALWGTAMWLNKLNNERVKLEKIITILEENMESRS